MLKIFKIKEEIMFNGFTHWPDFYRGVAYMLAGLTILLYALGIMEKGFTLVVILCASALIAVGCMKTGLYEKCIKILNKLMKKE
jgi:VIT1/CCC1 family predicted Fe2+/Mn2+ transporter